MQGQGTEIRCETPPLEQHLTFKLSPPPPPIAVNRNRPRVKWNAESFASFLPCRLSLFSEGSRSPNHIMVAMEDQEQLKHLTRPAKIQCTNNPLKPRLVITRSERAKDLSRILQSLPPPPLFVGIDTPSSSPRSEGAKDPSSILESLPPPPLFVGTPSSSPRSERTKELGRISESPSPPPPFVGTPSSSGVKTDSSLRMVMDPTKKTQHKLLAQKNNFTAKSA